MNIGTSAIKQNYLGVIPLKKLNIGSSEIWTPDNPPTIASFAVSPTSIVRGSTGTLTFTQNVTGTAGVSGSPLTFRASGGSFIWTGTGDITQIRANGGTYTITQSSSSVFTKLAVSLSVDGVKYPIPTAQYTEAGRRDSTRTLSFNVTGVASQVSATSLTKTINVEFVAMNQATMAWQRYGLGSNFYASLDLTGTGGVSYRVLISDANGVRYSGYRVSSRNSWLADIRAGSFTPTHIILDGGELRFRRSDGSIYDTREIDDDYFFVDAPFPRANRYTWGVNLRSGSTYANNTRTNLFGTTAGSTNTSQIYNGNTGQAVGPRNTGANGANITASVTGIARPTETTTYYLVARGANGAASYRTAVVSVT